MILVFGVKIILSSESFKKKTAVYLTQVQIF